MKKLTAIVLCTLFAFCLTSTTFAKSSKNKKPKVKDPYAAYNNEIYRLQKKILEVQKKKEEEFKKAQAKINKKITKFNKLISKAKGNKRKAAKYKKELKRYERYLEHLKEFAEMPELELPTKIKEETTEDSDKTDKKKDE